MHSIHSPDSMSSLDDLCENAIRRGLSGVCFTDHIDFDPTQDAFEYRDRDAYLADVQRVRNAYAGQLIVKTGAEITYQSEYASDIRRFLAACGYDYILGSIHNLHHAFVASPEYFVGKSEDEAYSLYWRETASMVASGMFRRIGHFDYIKTRRPGAYGPFELTRWQSEIVSILKQAVSSGATLEVNTSGIRKGLGEPYPSWDILGLYREVGGLYVTMGSDSHVASGVGRYFEEVHTELKAMGLTVCGEGIFER